MNLACAGQVQRIEVPSIPADASTPPEAALAPLWSADEVVRRAAVENLGRAGFVPRGSRISGFVDLAERDESLVLDLVFYTGRNLLRRRFYGVHRCFALEETARAIVDASAYLRERGFRLMLRDCYRPLSVQLALVGSPEYQGVATSLEYANHPRGAAVDARLADAQGRGVEMSPPGVPFREVMAANADVPELYRSRRKALRDAMVAAGLRPIRNEFWHFDLPRARRHPQIDMPVEAMARWVREEPPAAASAREARADRATRDPGASW